MWNRLTWEQKNDYPGLRWYSLEPARMYAFARLHYFYHEFQYRGRLSGYEIGDGWIDHGEEEELRSSLMLAKSFIEASLGFDVLFGESGIDFLKTPVHSKIEGVASQFQQAIKYADLALEMLDKQEYEWWNMATLISTVGHAINLLSTTISMYQGFKQKYLLSEGAAIWRASTHIHGHEDAPIFPLNRNLKQDGV